jgi:hypothetical protein
MSGAAELNADKLNDGLASGVNASSTDAASADGNTDIRSRDITHDGTINRAFVAMGSNVVINGSVYFSTLYHMSWAEVLHD